MHTDATPNTQHLMRLFRQATTTQFEAGVNWYPEANRIARELATEGDISVEAAAGIIAALSPLNGWGANVKLARRFILSGGTLDSGYLSLGLAKAARIYNGADPEAVLTSLKVGNFYRQIVSAGAAADIVIDRHAWSAVVNRRYPEGTIPKLTDKRYAAAAERYTRAAKLAGVLPGEFQAIVWLVWRNKFWAEGAFDSYAESAA